MQSPYELLNIGVNANDNDIKLAYLQQVKDYPPDRDPERFQAIRTAFESIKDQKCRLSHALFSKPVADFDHLLDQALQSNRSIKFGPEQFDKLLRISIDDKIYLNALPYSDKT